ncbi:protein EFFECTOR OF TRANSCRIPTION 2-like [Vicia villosa]|uniref:protein EFFECTOR OF TRANSCRIPTION 2-like n=1 Tax=Vicia villosa TaxID=3911 RepID=UPI00273CE548|nr:protein EFFECTOR OF TRANSCRIPTION 2-like [Vicia villosa]
MKHLTRNENNGHRIITFPATAQMLKREQCNHTKHDSTFSHWKILVGPSDWEDYSKGKEGSTRYRIHNLPENPGPGVYELGVAVSTSGLGREIYKLATRVVVVYLGKADNVRTRLQSYGRNGAHLGNGCSSFESSDQLGHSLFHEIFFQGFPVVYRWAPMQNKGDALQTESQLLSTFDYAWNTINNGTRRPDDILQMLNKISSGTRTFSEVAKSLLPFTQKKVGIQIKSSRLPVVDNKTDEADNGSYNFLSRVFKFNRSRPKIVVHDTSDFAVEKNGKICGVILDDGSICTKTPVEKRVRCHEHKGMRVNMVSTKGMRRSKSESERVFPAKEIRRSKSESEKVGESLVAESITKTVVICGIVLEDGSSCRKEPVKGRKRCHEHKGRRIRASVSINQK